MATYFGLSDLEILGNKILPGPTLVGLDPAQAITWRAFSPEERGLYREVMTHSYRIKNFSGFHLPTFLVQRYHPDSSFIGTQRRSSLR